MSIPVSMAGKRLTVRLKTQAEADRWHTAASDLKFSTMNQFIRTLVTNSIKNQENKQAEIEQRNRERIEELEHEIDLKKAEVGERDRIIRAAQRRGYGTSRREGYSPEAINQKKRGLVADFQLLLRHGWENVPPSFPRTCAFEVYSFVGLGKLLIEVERELTASGLIIAHAGGDIEWNRN